MQSLSEPKPSPRCVLVPEDGWQGAGVSPGRPVCQTPAGQGFGSPAAPHTCPHPGEGGQASVLAGRQCARPNVASPEAQTWPAGRYVPSHASGPVFHPQGLRDSTSAQLGLSGHAAVVVVVGCHQALGQPEQPGRRGGRSGCAGLSLSLCPSARQAAERRMSGNRCGLLSTPRNVALAATAGGAPCPHWWPGPYHQAGPAGAEAGGQEWDDARQHAGYPTWQ